MPYNGSGDFTPLDTFVNGQIADADDVNAVIADIADGLSNALTRDAQGKPTTNLDMDGWKIRNMGAPLLDDDAVSKAYLLEVPLQANMYRKQLLANGDFQVWQAGISIALAATRVRAADTWWGIRAGGVTGGTYARATGTFGTFGLAMQRDAANASTAEMRLATQLESADSFALFRNSKTVFVSLRLRAGANYSGGAVTVDLISGTGTDQNVLDGFTGASTVLTSPLTVVAGTVVYNVGSVALTPGGTQLGLIIRWTPTGVAGADDTIYVEEVQLSDALNANPYPREPFAVVLARCQRYYEKSFPYTTTPASNLGTIWIDGATWYALLSGAVASTVLFVPFKAQKREYGTSAVTYNPSSASSEIRNITDGVDCTSSSAGIGNSGLLLSCTQNAGAALGDRLYVDWVAADSNF